MGNVLTELFSLQNNIANTIPMKFKRYLKIDWDKRLIILTGARGTGKTTLVLQQYIENYRSTSECLYFSADNPLAAKKGIYNIGKEYFDHFGDTLIIDEVHKQTNWAVDVKALHDSFPNKKIIILGSSKLNILNQKGDLSRRALIYNLKGLSFREYLEFKTDVKFKVYALHRILKNHVDISSEINKQMPEIRKHFFNYKQYGYYPFFSQFTPEEYRTVLYNVLDKIIYEDVPGLKTIKSSSSLVFKKLIAYLAMSKIPTVKVASICNELDIPKETLYEYLDLLNRAEVINIVRRKNASVRSLRFSRIFLQNPNLYYAVSRELWTHNTELGNIREAFFVSQMSDNLYASQLVDYTIELQQKEVEIEIGGKNKSQEQIKQIGNSYIFKDDIVTGYGKVIPLYLAGFQY